MNEAIKNHIAKYNQLNKWPIDEESLIETITEANEIWSCNEEEYRHWIVYDAVVEIDGMFIMFGSAKGAGDQGISDAGWEFDPSTICEVMPKTIETTIYVPKELKN